MKLKGASTANRRINQRAQESSGGVRTNKA